MEDVEKREEEGIERMEQVDENIQKPTIGFPRVEREKPKSDKKSVSIFIIFLLGVGGLVWFFFFRNKEEVIVDEKKPSSFTDETVQSVTLTPTKEPIKRSEVKIKILNGTGISGGAGSLKKTLEDLGYSGVQVTNIQNQNYTSTKVTFKTLVTESIRTEIMENLEKIYKEVDSETKSQGDFDIEIITGFPKGYTASPTTKPKTTTTPTPSVKPTVTGSITPTTTSTPTPTP